MGIYSTQDFLSKLSDARGANETWEVIQDHFCGLGFDVVNFGVMDAVIDTPKGFFTNMSADWMRYYLDQSYNEIDPITIRAVTSNEPFVFTQDVRHKLRGAESNIAQQLFDEVAEVGIRSSFIAPFHENHPGHKVGFNLGSSSETKHFFHFMEHKIESILLGTALAQSFMPKLFTDRHSSKNWVPVNHDIQRLTFREVETLNWLANGLRVDRVAEKMSISNDTVNFHIKSIKRKLRAKTREHAVAIAFTEGLIR